MVILQVEIHKAAGKKQVTPIVGQPLTQDILKLEEEIIGIAATFPTALGGGNNGHAGIIMDPAAYLLLSGGVDFINPINPGVYPAHNAPSAKRSTRSSSNNSKPGQE